MSYVQTYLSRDQSLYAFDDNDILRNHTQLSIGDWVSNASGTFSIVNEHQEYPLFYSFVLQEENSSVPITLSLDNVQINGVDTTLLNNYNLLGHALFFCSVGAEVNATLSIRSIRDTSLTSSKSRVTSLNAGIQTPVRTGDITIFKKKASQIISAYGNGSYIKYESQNTFSVGDKVFIYNMATSGFNFELTAATVQYVTPEFFTIASSTVGYEQPSIAFALIDIPTDETASLPFASYAGENLTASINAL